MTAQVVEAPTVDAAKAEEGKDSSSTDAKDSTDKSSDASGKGALSEQEAKDLSGWMKTALSSRVSEVATTNRLVDSPAIISDHDNAVTRRMMQVPRLPASFLSVFSVSLLPPSLHPTRHRSFQTRMPLHAHALHAHAFARALHTCFDPFLSTWWKMAEMKQMGVTRQSHYKLLINPSHPLVMALNTVTQNKETQHTSS